MWVLDMNILNQALTFSFFAITFFSIESQACSCDELNIQRKNEISELIFIGKRVKKNAFLSFANNRYVFSPISVMKGGAKKDIKLWSKKSFFSCAAQFEKDHVYVVFASFKDGKYWASKCSSWDRNDDYLNYNEVFDRFYNLK
jgi:hypothetical protein